MYTCIVSKEKISNQLKDQELGFLRKCILRKDKRGKTHSPKSGPTATIRQPLAGCRPLSRGLAGRPVAAWPAVALLCARATCARRCAPPQAPPACAAARRRRAVPPCRERERERERERIGSERERTHFGERAADYLQGREKKMKRSISSLPIY